MRRDTFLSSLQVWAVLLLAVLLLGNHPSGLASQDTADKLQPEVQQLLPPLEKAPEQIRLVSFNVHSASDVPALVEALRTEPLLSTADVLLLQEVESHPSESSSQAHQLAAALHLNYVYAPARPTEDGGTHGLAILSRFPLQDIEVIPLKQYNLGMNTRRRIALAVTVQAGGRTLRIYNVHLDTRINSGARIEQLRDVVEAARKQANPAVVIGGDFNTNPFYWLLPMLPIFRSHQAKALDNFMQENGYNTPFADAGPTMNKRWAKFRTDSIYSRGLSVQKFGVRESVEVSDHFPLWVDLAWPTAESNK